jgi:membrane-associated phospholipid phosphatase
MRRFVPRLSVFVFFLAAAAVPIAAQSSVAPTPNQTPASAQRSLEKDFVKNIARDQAHIWTAPFRASSYEPNWLLPVGVGTAALLATDRNTSSWVDRRGGLPGFSHGVSWAGKAYVTGGVAAAFYLTGRATHNYRARETGILAAQALIDTGIVTEALKLATQRQRPNTDDGSAEFWDGGSSFPSGHASSIWSVATVISYEYSDHPLIKYGAYAAAVAVSASRYSGRNHFLSDIVVGSAIGFGIGRYVFKSYHDPDAGQPPAKKITRLIPQFVPYYNGRTRTYGGSLTWHL